MTMYRWDMTLFDGMQRMVGGRFVLASDAEAAIAAAFDQGQRDALAEAVKRVESIPDAHWVNPNRIAAAGCKAQVIAAIKGEQT